VPYGEPVAHLVFLGTPEIAVPPLRALVAAGHDVVLVVTRPDRRRGRGSATAPSPVKAAAQEMGIAVTEHVRDAVQADAELGVVVAFGRIIPADVLAALPMVNLHFSLLPRWRGAAPVERAILAGDDVTGVCVMSVAEGLDTGDLYACETVPVGDADLGRLRARLVDVGARLLVSLLANGVSGLPVPNPQRGEATYAEKVRPEELEIDWTDAAGSIARLVRLGRAYTWFRDRRLRVLGAAPAGEQGSGGPEEVGPVPRSPPRPGTLSEDRVTTGEGRLVLTRVQPEGSRVMTADEWRRGAHPVPGEVLGRR
jgi:methionyl-tRNA formyltransferase